MMCILKESGIFTCSCKILLDVNVIRQSDQILERKPKLKRNFKPSLSLGPYGILKEEIDYSDKTRNYIYLNKILKIDNTLLSLSFELYGRILSTTLNSAPFL